MIAFRDFAPDWKQKVLGLAVGGRQSVSDVVALANRWIAEHNIAVLSVETLVLAESAIDNIDKSEHDDTRYNVGMFELTGKRVQVVRVWYKTEN